MAKKMVGLIVNGEDIDDEVFEELCDMIYDFPDTIIDIKVGLKNRYQYKYFMKTVQNRKMLDTVIFTNPQYVQNLSSFKLKSFQTVFKVENQHDEI